jgi:N-hydroxyarylamine O-acetyltransferase
MLSENVVSRYLRILGVQAKNPSLDALAELTAAHLTGFPFENISKLFNRKRYRLENVPVIELFLDGAEHYRFGGTCYSNNFHFYSLLAILGYDVTLCSADMAKPDVHMVITARLDGREYLIDVGYAAPFVSPLPRDLRTDYVLELGRDRYMLRPQDSELSSRLDMYRDGVLKHGYRMKPAPRKLQDFQPAIADSFRPSATFLNSLLLARFYPRSSVVLHNLSLIESSGKECRVTSLSDEKSLPSVIERHFGIPHQIAEEVLSELPALQDAWT